jgi:cation diffusion facilitator family transporter
MPNRKLMYPVLGSILAAVVTLALKTTAASMTGSVGLLSDAAEAVVNLLAAGSAYVSLWYAARPVDSNHTYGHEKIEFFSSGLEGMLVLIAAIGIAVMAVTHFWRPEPLESLTVGIILAAVATVINFAAAMVLFRVGRTHRSIILEAEGRHLMADVWTSVAVVAGVGLVRLTGMQLFDPICALLMAGYILWTGAELVVRSFNGLMDHALPLSEQALVRAAIEAGLERGMTYHALRTRQAGTRRFIDFHLLVPGMWSVKHAHEIGSRIEEGVCRALADAEVTVHIEPIEEPAAWDDSALVAVEAAEAAARREKGEPAGK